MITFSKLEKKGHLGNQLFQIASTMGIAVKSNTQFCYPKWSYNDFFIRSLPLLQKSEWISFNEKQFHYNSIEFDPQNYDLEGWFQSEKYFDIDLTKSYFQFENVFLQNLREKYQEAFRKKTILISIRRGDFVDHPDYFQLPIKYYIQALIAHFPDWDQSNLIVLSDDIEYCKFHFSFLTNVFFADNLSAIQQLALGSLCDDFIISNSTFSWWCAWLGEKENSKVIRPLHYFTTSKREIDNDKDYFPERWTVFNHLDLKLDITDTNLIITKGNFILEYYLKHNFNFENTILKFEKNNNLSVESSKSVLLINDCILPPFLIYFAAKSSENSVGYTKGNFLNISKHLDWNLFQRQFDFGLFAKVLNKNNPVKLTKRLAFVAIKGNYRQTDNLDWNYYSNIFNFKKSGFIVLYSFAGKIRGITGCKYYAVTKILRLKILIKTKIKNIIRPKKK
ncbi:alpha-1,2-fucosyltransferase [Flavobacterium tructae]|uniref:alpha-1,2-fucosyltransferase n=1 Tax=Flavobacterium tructae TaxID=1114873 RepID=UPI002551EBBD|nr:alpha-1,2-fucosyltransferase [Flavobacterium tructae]MDL2143366.1 alpha-1,2-fucosyltransferase [Flavobacterium tructae]